MLKAAVTPSRELGVCCSVVSLVTPVQLIKWTTEAKYA